jgi:hypothetical protein
MCATTAERAPRGRRGFAALAAALALAALAALVPALVRADTVFLEGGGRVRGEIVSETPTTVTVRTSAGSLHVIKRDEIAKIERDRNPGQEYAERARRLSETDASGWYELGRFALEKGLKEEGLAAFRKTIAIDPDHPGAREALGHRKYKGRWLDEAGYKKAVEGLVEWSGQWVTPAEKEMFEQGFTRNEKGEWVRKEDLERQEEERKVAEARPKPAKQPAGGASEPPTEKPEARPLRPRPAPEAPPKAAPVDPEDDAWYDDHTTVMSWDDAQKTPHESQFYRIYTNIKPEYAKRYGQMMDTYNKMGFQRVFNAAENLKHGFPKGKIYIYPSHDAFKSGEGMGDGVGGYYQPGQNRVVCYHGRFGMTGTTRTVLTHEGTHQFEDFVIPGKMWNAPVWIIEGFAVFFESAIYDQKANKVKIGNIPRDRLMNLKQGISSGNYIKLPELIRTPQPAFTGFHYAHAWSLIYFMIYGGRTEYQRKTNQKVFSDLFFLARTKKVTPEDVEALWGNGDPVKGKENFARWEEEWKKWLLDLPYDWDPKDGLARKDDKDRDGKDGKKGGAEAGGKGEKDGEAAGGATETPDPGEGGGGGGGE